MTSDPQANLAHLKSWIGHKESVTDIAGPAPARGLSATLDRADFDWTEGDALPLAWQWIYLHTIIRQSELGPDGHPRRGGFLPPVPLPRRMIAGGNMRLIDPVRIGDRLTRESEIADVAIKQGRTGPLVFTTVRHAIASERGPALEEEQTIVYRDAPPAGAPPLSGDQAAKRTAPGAEAGDAPWWRTITPDPVLLFRFSALTFNGHRIHYDYPYATETESYPGLIFHGPLTAVLLLDLCREFAPERTVTRFDYRAVAPLFETESFTILGRPAEDGASVKLQALTPDGGPAMIAEATFD